MNQAVRVTVNLGPDVVDALRHIAAVRGSTLGDALAAAIGSELFFTRQRAAGGRILVAKPGGRMHEILPY